jgi:hypothetical protein
VLLWLPAYEWLRSAHDEAVHTARRYDRAGVRALAARAGLAVEQVTGAHAPLLPLAVARRWLDAGGGRPRQLALQAGPRALGAALEGVLALEAALLARLSLPAGLSFFARLRRPGDAAG